MHRFANPTRFMRYSATILPWAAWSTAALIAIGLYLALFVAPPDYQQGESVRIMFVHVPSAWMGLFFYTGMAVFGCGYLLLIFAPPIGDSVRPLAAMDALLDVVYKPMQRDIAIESNVVDYNALESPQRKGQIPGISEGAPVPEDKVPKGAMRFRNRGPTGDSYQMPIRKHFRAVGHSLFALVFAVIGGLVGQWFSRTKKE